MEYVPFVYRSGIVACLFVAIEHLGEMELAATNVIRSVSTLFFVIVNSFAATTGSLVSNLLGAGQKEQVIPLCNRVYSFGICYRFSSGHPCSDFLPSDYWHLYGKYVSDANCPSALCGYAAELCLCLARLCLYERRNRYRATRMTFIFQLITIAAYQIYLWSISGFSTSLSVYWTVEYLYVILLGLLSVIYLKHIKLNVMMKKIYPRTGDTQTVYLNAVVKDPSIEVGDYTIYNDFVSDPLFFERDNVLYHYPINHERLIIGKFCSIACGAKFLFNCANHALKSLSTYTFPLFFEDWDLEKSGRGNGLGQQRRHRDRQRCMDRLRSGDYGWRSHRQRGYHSRPCRCYERCAALYDSRRCSCPTDKKAFR